MTGLLQDMRAFLRRTRDRPVWTLAIVAVLALGIGANTGMFTGFDAWVLRPLPLAEPERLLELSAAQPALGRTSLSVAPRDLADLRADQDVFSGLAAFARTDFNVDDELAPYRVPGVRIEAELFPLLGVGPVLGRQLSEADDMIGQPAPVALISHRLWRERYDGTAEVLGHTIRLQGQLHEIVGVMPEGFRFPEWAEIWTPLGLDPETSARDQRWLSVVARLRDETSEEQARAKVATVGTRLTALYPETNTGWTFDVVPLRQVWAPPVITVALTASLVTGLLVLVIICANVAGLLLAQATARARETALRTALGASRARLVRQTLIDNLCLAVPAGLLGGLIGIAWNDWMMRLAPIEPPYMFAMKLDWKGWVYTFVITLLVACLCTLAPFARWRDLGVAEVLRTGARSSGGRSTARLRGALVIGELGLSTALAVAALLMVKSFLQQQHLDHGYRTDGLLVATLPLDTPELEDPEERVLFLDRLQRGLLESGTATAVGTVNALPFGDDRQVGLEAEGRPAERGEGVRAAHYSVSDGYLELLEVPILRGRLLSDGEAREGGDVVVVSQELARNLWGGLDVVGRRLRRIATEPGPWLEVVGVVDDVRGGQDMVRRDSVDAQLYVPYAAAPLSRMTMVLASEQDTSTTAALLRQEIRNAGFAVPAAQISTLREAMTEARWVSRLFGELLTLYAAIALGIAALGLYGLVADSVMRRRHEVAVRMAMGARPRQIVGHELTRTLRLCAAGIASGVMLSLATTRFGAAMLVDVDPRDPLVLGGVVALLGLTSLIATYLPARRASATDPSRLLRSE
jgi:predicted permease